MQKHLPYTNIYALPFTTLAAFMGNEQLFLHSQLQNGIFGFLSLIPAILLDIWQICF